MPPSSPQQRRAAIDVIDDSIAAHLKSVEVLRELRDVLAGGSFYLVRESDVGRRILDAFGKSWPLVDSIGRIQEHDVGKRVYRYTEAARNLDMLEFETSDQRDKREEEEDEAIAHFIEHEGIQ